MNTPKEIVETLTKTHSFIETLDGFNPQTEKQQKALQNVRGLVSLIEKFDARPPKPVMFALHGRPGTGKTHLLKGFLNELALKNIPYDFLYNPNTMLEFRPNGKQIFAVDDLFANRQSIDQFDSYDFKALEKVIFDVYSNRKILIFTSNFSLSELVEFIKKHDQQGRLSSSIDEFVGICPDMEIDGEDYMKKVGEITKDLFGEFFS